MTPYERVVLEVTEACPHACLHCYNYWRENRASAVTADTLSRAEIRNLIRKIKNDAPLKQVGLSGGEPLLRADTPGIVADLADAGLSAVVITSGALLTPALVAKFPQGTIFEITLFSADAGLHDRIAGRAGAFRKVLAGMVNVLRRKCTLAVSVVVNRLNAEDVSGALELGIAFGAEAFLLNRINLTKLTLPQADWLAPTAAQLKDALGSANTAARKYGATIGVAVPLPPCVVDPTPYRHLHFGWCPRGGPESYYTVSYNGMLRPCNHSSLVLGDLTSHSFAELTESRKSAEFWAPIPSECRTCRHPLGDKCRGGCPAASDECYGTRERCDPLVQICGGLQNSMKDSKALPGRPKPHRRDRVLAASDKCYSDVS